MKTKHILLSLALLVLSSALTMAAPLGTAFTYQGKLTDGGTPANGNYDLRFILYDAVVGGSQVGPILTNAAVLVSGGLFTVPLDFGGGVFTGDARWLEIGVRANGGGNFTTLSQRQPFTPTPYALYASNAGAAATASAVAPGAVTGSGIATGQVVRSLNGLQDSVRLLPGTNVSVNTAGDAITISATPGTVVTNGGWGVSGNAGTTVNNFLGTTDGQALELRVNSTRALRIEPQTFSPNLIGGVASVSAGVEGATISGGGNRFVPHQVTASYGTVGGGTGNSEGGTAGVIGGGGSNSILTNAAYAAISGGQVNSILAAGTNAVIGGGQHNHVDAAWSGVVGGQDNAIDPVFFLGARVEAEHSAILGGRNNSVLGAKDAWVGGGQSNQVFFSNLGVLGGGASNRLSGAAAFLGGGLRNTNAGAHSAVVAGLQNLISDTGDDSFVGGGWSNALSGTYSAIVGGSRNTITSGASFSAIGGGAQNQLGSDFGTIGGGVYNTNNGPYATVAGGYMNVANGGYSFVAGGNMNVANGSCSFAAGSHAKALNTGSFVWADSTLGDFTSTASDQFLIRSAGVGINTTNPIGALHVVTRFDQAPLNLNNPYGDLQIMFQNNYGDIANLKWHREQPQLTPSLVFNVPGNFLSLYSSGLYTLNDFVCLEVHESSDRNQKTNMEPVNATEVLERVLSLPVSTWAFTNRLAERHLGPMAQDFRAVFGLGDDDKTIGPRDANGVALAAIQGLNQKLEEKNAALEKQVAQLTALVKTLAEKVNGGGQ
jgi:hypothetical protein